MIDFFKKIYNKILDRRCATCYNAIGNNADMQLKCVEENRFYSRKTEHCCKKYIRK